MHNSKLYSILGNFSRIEQNRLRKYLISPYFNKNEGIIGLFDAFIRQINSENGVELDKEKVWQKLYPGKNYNDVRFRKLNSDLLKLVESFLAQQIYEENPLHQATYLVEAVGRKKMGKLYNSTMRTARRLSEQQTHKPGDYYYYQYKIEKNYYDLAEFELKRGRRINVEEIANNLDRFYLAEKLRSYLLVLSQKQFITHEYQYLFIDEIIEHIKSHNYDDIPQISIYYQIVLMLSEKENAEHYYKLKELLQKYGSIFPKEEEEGIYGAALNYCIANINQGNREFLHELFELHKIVLEREIIFVDGYLSPWDFKNFVTVAQRLGKYAWAENFINDYGSRLPEEFRETAVSFNKARLMFYQKKFGEAIDFLQAVDYEDVSDNLDTKGLLLQTYYELDEIEPMISLMESLRTFVNRHKEIPVQRRKNYLNLIKFLKKIIKIHPGDKVAIEKLKNEVGEMTGIAANRAWVQEKIAELV